MTLKIVLGAVAALALAQGAYAAEPAATGASEPQATDTSQDCSSPYAASGCTQAEPGQAQSPYGQAQPSYGSSYGQGDSQYGQGSWGAAPAPEQEAESERWRRPERRGWRRLFLPVDLVREGASAVRHSF